MILPAWSWRLLVRRKHGHIHYPSFYLFSPKADVPTLVDSYLNSPRVVFLNKDDITFADSVKVFTQMRQEAVSPSSTPTTSSSSVQPTLPTTSMSASSPASVSYDKLLQEYKEIKDRQSQQKAAEREKMVNKKR
jgi:hypothetical protein